MMLEPWFLVFLNTLMSLLVMLSLLSTLFSHAIQQQQTSGLDKGILIPVKDQGTWTWPALAWKHADYEPGRRGVVTKVDLPIHTAIPCLGILLDFRDGIDRAIFRVFNQSIPLMKEEGKRPRLADEAELHVLATQCIRNTLKHFHPERKRRVISRNIGQWIELIPQTEPLSIAGEIQEPEEGEEPNLVQFEEYLLTTKRIAQGQELTWSRGKQRVPMVFKTIQNVIPGPIWDFKVKHKIRETTIHTLKGMIQWLDMGKDPVMPKFKKMAWADKETTRALLKGQLDEDENPLTLKKVIKRRDMDKISPVSLPPLPMP